MLFSRLEIRFPRQDDVLTNILHAFLLKSKEDKKKTAGDTIDLTKLIVIILVFLVRPI